MESKKRPAGNKCQYFNCRNTRNISGLRLFRFPHKDEKLCRQWVINCGNLHLIDLPPHVIKNKYLCEEHFSDCDYRGQNQFYLKKDALPKKCFENKEEADQILSLNIPRRKYKRRTIVDVAPTKESFPTIKTFDRENRDVEESYSSASFQNIESENYQDVPDLITDIKKELDLEIMESSSESKDTIKLKEGYWIEYRKITPEPKEESSKNEISECGIKEECEIKEEQVDIPDDNLESNEAGVLVVKASEN